MLNISKHSIFVVEDNTIYLKALTLLLRADNNSNVIGFSSGEECLKHLHKKPIIVFLDIGLSKLNGIDILKQIKLESKKSKVIMLSSQDEEEVIKKCIQAGAYDYIVKDDKSIEQVKQIVSKIKLMSIAKTITTLFTFIFLAAIITYILL